LVEAPTVDLSVTKETSFVDGFDLLIIGTPTMGLKPTPEVHSFVKRLPQGNGKKTILFCTYAIRQGGTLSVLEKELTSKGYANLLSVSKRGLKPGKTDFAEALEAVRKAIS
jgi:hypothetical protein